MPGQVDISPTLQPKKIDIISAVFNEEEVIATFHEKLRTALEKLPYPWRIVYVDDGSSDASLRVLNEIAQSDARVQVIALSRNFGQQAALTAGMDQADADFVITLDSDGQHPPEMIAEMLRLAESGYDIVQTQRIEEDSASFLKRATSSWFYRLINTIGNTRIQPGSADFRLLSRPVVESLQSMREYHRFLRGMVTWVGFPTIILPYKSANRLGGKTKYSPAKMFRLAMDAIFSFSLIPLYIGISLGILLLVLAVIEMIYVLRLSLIGDQSLVRGWSSLMFVLLVIGGILMITMGFIGVYVGYIFQEVKGRPIYIIRSQETKQDLIKGEEDPDRSNPKATI